MSILTTTTDLASVAPADFPTAAALYSLRASDRDAWEAMTTVEERVVWLIMTLDLRHRDERRLTEHLRWLVQRRAEEMSY